MATYDLTSSIPSASSLVSGDILNCPYSGTYKQITLSKGTYKLECWGAQGGAGKGSGGSVQGGLGGYSVGILSLSVNTILFLYTGGMGATGASLTNALVSGGFNGGGAGFTNNSNFISGGGGGASDIRIETDSYAYRVIVAGGGGGHSDDGNNSCVPGVGGGTTGGNASTGTTTSTNAQGGTQTAGGSGGQSSSTQFASTQIAAGFGYGGSIATGRINNIQGAGGGGGWYGGGFSIWRAAAGGSGYIHQGTNSASALGSNYILTDASTIAGNTSFTDPDGSTVTGHSGDGYIRITVISLTGITKPAGKSILYTGSSQPYALDNFDSNLMDITGDLSGTNIGDYSVIISLKDSSQKWIDGTNSPITVIWSIIDRTSGEYTINDLPSSFIPNDIINCDYTGSSQSVILPPGEYKLECWGAQGGYRSSATYGGKGGYSVGTLTLTENTTVYLYSGGSGRTGGASGGFNGGGRRYSYYGGGGASDIRLRTDSLYARVIVAGGGGSDGATSRGGGAGGGTSGQNTTASSYGTGGYGGGASASATSTYGGTSYFAGISATQPTSTSPTTSTSTYNGFGWGGSGPYYSSGYGGAGGGGWFGGVGTYPDGSGDDDKGGGGGSGYVYTSSTASNYPSGCLLTSADYLIDASTIAGNTSFTDPDGSTVTGHSGDGYIRITVNKIYITKPTVGTNSLAWTGSSLTYTPSGYTSTQMIISNNTGINPEGYIASVSPRNGYEWTDKTTIAVSLSWSIIRYITKPTGGLSRTYNGSSQSYILSGFDSSLMDISGNISEINADTYTVSVSIKSSLGTTYYKWSDGTTSTLSLNWSIIKISITKPTGGKQLPYIGSAYTNINELIDGYDSSTMSASGDTSGTNVGIYNISISLQDTTNYQWSDGTILTVALTWAIIKNVVTKPHGSYQPNASYDININYAGSSTSVWPYIEDYDSTIMNYSGWTSPMIVDGSALGGYEVEFSLKDTTNYEWSDGTTGYVKIKWAVIRGIVTSPTGGNSFVYRGTPYDTISSLINGYDSDLMTVSGDTSETDVGNYTITVALKDKNNYQWSSTNNYLDLSLNWYITPLLLIKPTGKIIYYTGFVYDDPNDYLNNFNSSIMNISGDISEIDEGTYTVLISLKDSTNYNWNDNSISTLSLDWIIKRLLTKPTGNSREYNGSSQLYLLNNFDPDLMSITGDTSGQTVGTYSVTISLSDLIHYEWSDNTNSAINVNWYITKRNIVKPTGGSREYNGSSQSYILNGYDSNLMDVSGELSGIDKGNYSVQVSLKDTNNNQWSDGTTTTINIIWQIKGSIFIYVKINNNSWEAVKAYIKTNSTEHKKVIEGYIKTVNGWRSILRDD